MKKYELCPLEYQFRSTSLKEARQNVTELTRDGYKFRSTSLKEARLKKSRRYPNAKSFRSTSLKEARQCKWIDWQDNFCYLDPLASRRLDIHRQKLARMILI